MGNKIFIICNFYSIQVWSAIKLHINYISKAGGVPVLIIKKGSASIDTNELKGFEIWEYSNLFSLFMHILTAKDVKYVWCPDFIVVIKMFIPCLLSCKKIYFWVQGILPEEDYMKFHKKYRFYIFNILEYLALLFSSNYILVSYSMLDFFTEKILSKKNK